MQNDSIKKWMGILVFTTSSIEFGCNIAQASILSPQKQKLNSEGQLIYNGKELPVYNMEDLLKLKGCPPSQNNYILIIDSPKGQLGIEVDEIKEILPFDKKLFQKIQQDSVANKEFFLGEILFEGGKILFPDFDKIISFLNNKESASIF